MKIGLKIKYTKNIPIVLPYLNKLSGIIDFFEFGVRPEEDFREFDALRHKKLFYTIHAPLQENDFNPAEPLGDEMNEKNIRLALDAANHFDAKAIIVHPGDKESENSSLENVCRFLKKYYDKRYFIENLPYVARSLPYPRIAYKIDDLKIIKENTKTGVCLDFGHALLQVWRDKKDYYEYIDEFFKKLKPTYFHLHNNDGPEDRHWTIKNKMGFIDYRKIVGYFSPESMLLLEIYVLDNDGFSFNDVLGDVDYLRNLLIDTGKIK